MSRLQRVNVGSSPLRISRLVLGGNVFGWTVDEQGSYDILDAYFHEGGNAIDLADSYPHWAPGCTGGESEEIVGRWMRERGNRADVVVCTKVGKFPRNYGLTRGQILGGIEGSLRRLQTEYVDLYYCHLDDKTTPLEETLRTLTELVDDGRVRAIAASNYSADRLEQALRVADDLGLARFCAVQPQYSLVAREEFEGPMQVLCEREGLACLPFWPLAAGYLTDKYRDVDPSSVPRGPHVTPFITERNEEILEVVRVIADRHRVSCASVAIAWLLTRPTVAAPIASVSRADQLPALMEGAALILRADEIEVLNDISQPPERM